LRKGSLRQPLSTRKVSIIYYLLSIHYTCTYCGFDRSLEKIVRKKMFFSQNENLYCQNGKIFPINDLDNKKSHFGENPDFFLIISTTLTLWKRKSALHSHHAISNNVYCYVDCTGKNHEKIQIFTIFPMIFPSVVGRFSLNVLFENLCYDIGLIFVIWYAYKLNNLENSPYIYISELKTSSR